MKILNSTTPIRLFNFRSCFFTFFFILWGVYTGFAQPFITTWKTDNPGTSNATSITIPTKNGETYNYDVDWDNDGTFDEFGITGDVTHEFGVAGIYTIAIQGDFPYIYFNNNDDCKKILAIEQWGNNTWESMFRAFKGASNLTSNATDTPDLSSVTDMVEMFSFATAFNGNLSAWNVSNVTKMRSLFQDAVAFNGDLSAWDVSGVTDMAVMFSGAGSFNGDLSAWNVTNVKDMGNMFAYATAFNGDISNWDVSSATNMSRMFQNATAFNRNLSTWNVSNVTDMRFMFNDASIFNGDISTWDVSSVTDMGIMFSQASAFNRDINMWNVTNVTDMNSMFSFASSFNRDLSDWDVSNVKDMNSMFNVASIFNGDISTWDVSNVTNMTWMFRHAKAFNGDLSTWDVSNVIEMKRMFQVASSFNGDISSWDVSNVTDMEWMFNYTDVFNQDLGSWDINSITNMNGMLDSSGLSVTNYDNTLIGWESQGISNINVGALGLAYCNSESARNSLVNNYGWTITGDLLDCSELTLPFITTWKTDNPGSSNSTSITIPTKNGETYNYDVDWDNDGIFDEFGISGDVTHDFGVAGIYTVAIQGEFPRIYFNDTGDKEKILAIDQWGSISWTSMAKAFYGAEHLVYNASDSPDFSQVENVANMFRSASSFNGDVSSWDMSNIQVMSNMFRHASSFNQDLGGWNISAVINMSNMLSMSGLSINNYDNTLIGWESQGIFNIKLKASELKYCAAELERASLINNFGWMIVGDNSGCMTSTINSENATLSDKEKELRSREYSGVIPEIQLDVYPNPFQEYVSIDIFNPSEKIIQIILTNQLGEKIWSLTLPDHTVFWNNEFHLKNSGVYYISVHAENQLINKKIIKVGG